jgi:hypothetical protein
MIQGCSMSRSLIAVVVVVVLLVGAMVWLAGRDASRTPVKVEKAVALENLR